MTDEMKYLIIRIIASFILFIIAILVPDIIILKLFFYLVAYLIISYDVIKEAIENILKGEWFDENFLMFIATIGAFITGEYPEAVMVMWLYQIGEGLQDYAVDKSRNSITELMDIRPDFANIERDGKLIEISPQDVSINDIIIVKPGEKVPLDGIIVEGNGFIDNSSLTGESVLQKVEVGSAVYSGTINQSSMLKVKVTKKYEDSTVSKILEMVENASNKKAKTENFITKFAKYYTPIVVFSALVLAFIPPIILKDANLFDYIHRACSFLVISCPCALVISIPLGFFGGLGGASKQGILIKGSNYLEALSKIKTIVFDKTGTLTKGTFEVTKIESTDISPKELLKIAAYAENYSEHPIALSIKKAYGSAIDGNLVSNSTEIHGRGLEVTVENNVIDIGNEKLMQSIVAEFRPAQEIGTIIYVAINKKYAGYLVISDQIKEEAGNTIAQLKANHITPIMLTGDNKTIAQFVATEINIQEFHSELLPTDKVTEIEKIIENNHQKVAFVGDGVNDAPVLTRADIGIAMGGLGSDAAIEAADVVIMDDNLTKIDTSIKIAKKTLKIVKQNIVFALTIKILVLLLSTFGISTMWEAVFADVGVSFIAILNALRALHYHEKK